MSKPTTSSITAAQVEKFKQLLVSGTAADWLRLSPQEREMLQQYKTALAA